MAEYAGNQVFIKVDLNGVGGSGANWTKIGQQRDGSLSRGTDKTDSSHKDNLGFASATPTRKNWSVSGGGVLDPADSVYQYLLTAWRNATKIWVQIDRSAITAGVKEEGKAVISMDEEFNDGDLCMYSFEFEGDGTLTVSP